MNREDAKILAPIIQAFGDGKDVKYRGDRKPAPKFNGKAELYSIAEPKPPKDIWVNLDEPDEYRFLGYAYTCPTETQSVTDWQFFAAHYRRVDDE